MPRSAKAGSTAAPAKRQRKSAAKTAPTVAPKKRQPKAASKRAPAGSSSSSSSSTSSRASAAPVPKVLDEDREAGDASPDMVQEILNWEPCRTTGQAAKRNEKTATTSKGENSTASTTKDAVGSADQAS